MVTTIAFLEPQYSWLLLALVPLGIILYISLRRKLNALSLFQASSSFVSSLRFSKFIPVLTIVTVLIFSLTRPISGYEDITIPGTRSDVLLVVDISQSMRAADVKPSRLTLAKRKIFDTIDLLASNRQGVRLGIILFAGSAYVYCPLTEDYSVVKIFAESINTSLISAGGSDLLEALRLALNTFRVVNAKDPRVVILSDGEESSTEQGELIEMLERYSIPVDAIGFGSKEGAPIKLASGRFLRASDGNLIVSTLKPEVLQTLAQSTGGTYQLATPHPTDISKIITSIQTGMSGNSEKGEEKIRLYREIGPFLVLAAFALLCVFLLLRYPSLVFSFVFLFATADIAFTQTVSILPSEAAQKAFRAYRSGDFEAATTLYRDALMDDPDDSTLKAGLAASLYKTKNYEEAATLYEELEAKASTGRELFEAAYNKGNSFLQAGRANEAISAYEKALQAKPDDKRTTDNLALAKLLKEKQQSNPDDSQKQDSKKQNKQGEKKEEKSEEKSKGATDKEKDRDKSTDKQDSKDTKTEPSAEKEPGTDEKHGDSGRRDDPSEKKNPDQGTSNPNKQKSDQQSTEGESLDSFDVGDKTRNPEEAKPDNPQSDTVSKYSKEKLDKAEAATWLDSLPDSPVLLRQKGGRSSTKGQTW